jgi:hypothetical protein
LVLNILNQLLSNHERLVRRCHDFLGTTEDFLDGVDQSVGSEYDSLFGNGLELGDVGVWDNLVFALGEAVVGGDGNLVRFLADLLEICGLDFRIGESVLSGEIGSNSTKVAPGGS